MLSLSARSPAAPSISSRTMSAWPAWRLRLGDHVHEDPVQRHLAALAGHHGTWPGASSGQRVDRGVGVRPGPVVQPDDVLARLVGGRPHVGVGLGVVVEPRQRLGERPAERVAEVARPRRWPRA